jgi:hypothetical protein
MTYESAFARPTGLLLDHHSLRYHSFPQVPVPWRGRDSVLAASTFNSYSRLVALEIKISNRYCKIRGELKSPALPCGVSSSSAACEVTCCLPVSDREVCMRSVGMQLAGVTLGTQSNPDVSGCAPACRKPVMPPSRCFEIQTKCLSSFNLFLY